MECNIVQFIVLFATISFHGLGSAQVSLPQDYSLSGIFQQLFNPQAQSRALENQEIKECIDKIGAELFRGAAGGTAGTAGSGADADEPTPQELRLPRHLIPVQYRLKIKTYIPSSSVYFQPSLNFTFDGEIEILMQCKAAATNVTLHSVNLNITESSIELRTTDSTGSMNGPLIPLARNGLEIKEKLQMVVFKLNSTLNVGNYYKLYLKYRGPISDDLAGLYRSYYRENGSTK